MENVQNMYSQEDVGACGMVIWDRLNGYLVNPNSVQKSLYHLFTYLKYGHLGRGNRISIPQQCVMEKIHEQFPEPGGGQFMCFQEGTQPGNTDDVAHAKHNDDDTITEVGG